MSLYFASSPIGSLEDWDVAVQKTETRLNRINAQRAKVGGHALVALDRCIIKVPVANVTMYQPSPPLLGS